MDRFQQHGIKVLFALNGQNPSQGGFVRKEYDGIKGVQEISEAFIRRFAAHPAMLGYYLSDENPVLNCPMSVQSAKQRQSSIPITSA